ncbi:MAG: hypothetical protein ACOVOR_02580 [Rhabdochlamydiaceae bacterium]
MSSFITSFVSKIASPFTSDVAEESSRIEMSTENRRLITPLDDDEKKVRVHSRSTVLFLKMLDLLTAPKKILGLPSFSSKWLVVIRSENDNYYVNRESLKKWKDRAFEGGKHRSFDEVALARISTEIQEIEERIRIKVENLNGIGLSDDLKTRIWLENCIDALEKIKEEVKLVEPDTLEPGGKEGVVERNKEKSGLAPSLGSFYSFHHELITYSLDCALQRWLNDMSEEERYETLKLPKNELFERFHQINGKEQNYFFSQMEDQMSLFHGFFSRLKPKKDLIISIDWMLQVFKAKSKDLYEIYEARKEVKRKENLKKQLFGIPLDEDETVVSPPLRLDKQKAKTREQASTSSSSIDKSRPFLDEVTLARLSAEIAEIEDNIRIKVKNLDDVALADDLETGIWIEHCIENLEDIKDKIKDIAPDKLEPVANEEALKRNVEHSKLAIPLKNFYILYEELINYSLKRWLEGLSKEERDEASKLSEEPLFQRFHQTNGKGEKYFFYKLEHQMALFHDFFSLAKNKGDIIMSIDRMVMVLKKKSEDLEDVCEAREEIKRKENLKNQLCVFPSDEDKKIVSSDLTLNDKKEEEREASSRSSLLTPTSSSSIEKSHPLA